MSEQQGTLGGKKKWFWAFILWQHERVEVKLGVCVRVCLCPIFCMLYGENQNTFYLQSEMCFVCSLVLLEGLDLGLG